MAETIGPVDCDIHVTAVGVKPLLPYLDAHWRDIVITRGIDRMELTSYPLKVPFSSRPDWRGADGNPGGDLAMLQRNVLDRWGTRFGILNCLHGAVALYSEDLGGTLVSAVNDWIAEEWLSRDTRLRASILVHTLNPAVAVAEIEKRAHDHRFVQVLLLAGAQQLVGHRTFWPVFEAAQRHKLPIAIHAGSINHSAPSPNGWPFSFAEDYANHANSCQHQVMSMIVEGVFTKFPDLTVVLSESGFAWVPNFIWRLNKTWRGTRIEVPWLNERPSDIFRRHVRITAQPIEGPPEPGGMERLLRHIGTDDILLFATDYPHWHFDGDDALPADFPAETARKMMYDTPYRTYPRLREACQ